MCIYRPGDLLRLLYSWVSILVDYSFKDVNVANDFIKNEMLIHVVEIALQWTFNGHLS